MAGAQDHSAGTRYLRKLSHAAGDAGAVEASTVEALNPVHAEEALARAIHTIERETGKPVDALLRAEVERLFLEDGKQAIGLLKQQGIGARIPPKQQDALEAIVEFDGSRPTLPIPEGDAIDPADAALDQWAPAVKKFAAQISTIASAVGRVDLDGTHKGTAFVVKQGLVLTNRHVLQQIAVQRGDGEWEFRGTPTLSFDSDPETSRKRSFTIDRVVLFGPDAIDFQRIDYNKLDYAILGCRIADGALFPEPLSLESDEDKIAEGRPIFTIGYPARPRPDTYADDVLVKLFQHRYGIKRFAPGEIDRTLGTAAAGTGETVFCHDATTLGGNSGSCVVDLGNDGRLVVGLHFAGKPKLANYAHANARLRERLADSELTWRAWV
jgi:hypothetical protein